MQRTSRNPPRTSRVIHWDETVVVAETGALCVVIWRVAVTKVPFEWQRSALAEVVLRNPHGAAFLCVVEQSAKPPEDELRRASSQMILSHGEQLKCVACVMEGEGFRVAINRSALSGMILLLRNRKSPVSVFAKVPEAVRWMSEHIEIPAIGELVSTVENIRSYLPMLASKR
jgi:hypothetical protein